MFQRFILLLLFITGLAVHSLHAQNKSVSALFRKETPLAIRLNIPIEKVRKSKSDTIYFKTVIHYQNGQNTWDSIPAHVKVKGKFRKENCFFIPLKIKFRKIETDKTPFAGIKSLNMTLPCKSGANNNELVLKEQLCYSIFQVVSPFALCTRRVAVSLTDTGGSHPKTYDIPGFMVEDDDPMAKRYGGTIADASNLHPVLLNDTASLRLAFFEFMISNTDWSSMGHNIKVFLLPNHRLIPVPHDFDMSGLVDAPYAEVNRALPISNVRERLYRGFCRSAPLTQYVRAEYISLEPTIHQVIDRYQGDLNKVVLEETKYFVTEFFKILKDDLRFKENILSQCRTH